LQPPVCAGPAIPAPAVTYTGDQEITITFDTDAAYSTYELVIMDKSTFFAPDLGRDLTKSGITSPFVVNLGNIGEFDVNRGNVATAFPESPYTLMIVGVEGDGSKTQSPNGLNQGSVSIKEQPGAAAPTGIQICGLFEYATPITNYESANSKCPRDKGVQTPRSLRVSFRSTSYWGGTSNPKTEGFYYIIEMSTTSGFDSVIVTQNVPIEYTPDVGEDSEYIAILVEGACVRERGRESARARERARESARVRERDGVS